MDGYNENIGVVSGCVEDAGTVEFWEDYNAGLIILVAGEEA